MSERQHILIIKHGALGDVILAQGPFQAIAAHHKGAKITLLTTKGFDRFLSKSGLFDEIVVDLRPKIWNLPGMLKLRRFLRAGKFDRVYDLQTSTRSSSYFKLFAKNARPEWSGIAPGASHRHQTAHRNRLHTSERQREQLTEAGIDNFPAPDFSWAVSDIDRFDVTVPFAVLVPGGSAHRPEKRWPAASYAEIARRLSDSGIQPVLIGGTAERDALDAIAGACPGAVNLMGQTDLFDIATLGRHAALALGNDTGPMHLLAAVGCPSLTLFSSASTPQRSRPRGPVCRVLQRDNLSDLPVNEVMQSLEEIKNGSGQAGFPTSA